MKALLAEDPDFLVIRGFAGRSVRAIGNFYADLGRFVLYAPRRSTFFGSQPRRAQVPPNGS